jgi:hypothetical protein
VLAQDNLNTHKPASLYEAFPAAEARRLVERFGSLKILGAVIPRGVFTQPGSGVGMHDERRGGDARCAALTSSLDVVRSP